MTTSSEGSFIRAYPSDSQLSKLGSLNVGWSTISSKSSIHQSHLCINDGFEIYCQLSEKEMEAIEDVIRRAAELENEERLRQIGLLQRHQRLLSKASGNGTSSCVLCGTAVKGSQPKKCMVCHDCGKKMCSRCTNNYSLKGETTVSLCKLCYSERELWKKTGAWFYGHLPWFMSCPDRSSPGNALTVCIDKDASLSECSGLSSTSLDISASSSVNEFPVHLTKTPPTPVKGGSAPPYVQNTSQSSTSMSYCNINPLDQCVLSPERAVHPVASRLFRTRGRKLESQQTSDEAEMVTESDALTVPPRYMRASSVELQGNVLNSQPGTSSAAAKSKTLPLTKKYGMSDCGSIEFTMKYSKESSELTVCIIKCLDLPPADVNGLSDPYVVMYLSFNPTLTKRSTKVMYCNLNPVFDDEKVYHGITLSNIRHSDLTLMVYDHDVISKDDFLGGTSIPLRRVFHEEVGSFRLALQAQFPTAMPTAGADMKGQVLINLRYSTASKSFTVKIIRAARLHPSQSTLSVNPYVKINLLRDKHIEVKRKTAAVTGTVNPDYNEEITVPIDLKKLQSCVLKISVWNNNKSKRNFILGSASLSVTDTVHESFKNALSHIDIPSEEWVTLS